MMKIIFNNKIYFFLIIFVILYIFEFTLFLKTFNGGYFLSKITNNNEIVSSKFISNFVTKNNTHLSVFNNQKIKIYCNKKKNLSHNFDKYGFINSKKQ